MVVGHTALDELLAAIGNGRLCREVDLSRIQYGLVSHNGHLSLIVAKRLHAEY